MSDESDVIKQQKTEEKRVRRQQENLARKQSGKEMQVDELSDSSASSQSSTRSTLKSLKYNIDCMNKIMSNKPDGNNFILSLLYFYFCFNESDEGKVIGNEISFYD